MKMHDAGSALLLAVVSGCGSDGVPDNQERVVLDSLEGCEATLLETEKHNGSPNEFEIPRRFEFEWLGPSQAPVSQRPEPGITTLDLQASCEEDVRVLESLVCDGMVSCNVRCVSRLERDCTITMETDDGLFVAAGKQGALGRTNAGMGILTVSSPSASELDPMLGDTLRFAEGWQELEARLEVEWSGEVAVGRLLFHLAGKGGDEGLFTLAVLRSAP